VERGAGNYVNRPPYAPFYEAVKKRIEANAPTPVKR
jgi:dihydropyrimidinase